MFLLIGGATAILVVGTFALINGIRRAPLGEETEEGFRALEPVATRESHTSSVNVAEIAN